MAKHDNSDKFAVVVVRSATRISAFNTRTNLHQAVVALAIKAKHGVATLYAGNNSLGNSRIQNSERVAYSVSNLTAYGILAGQFGRIGIRKLCFHLQQCQV